MYRLKQGDEIRLVATNLGALDSIVTAL